MVTRTKLFLLQQIKKVCHVCRSFIIFPLNKTCFVNSDFVKVLKLTYVYSRSGDDKTHIAQETIIESAETVESMELYKTNTTVSYV